MLKHNPYMLSLFLVFPLVGNCIKDSLNDEKLPIRETAAKELEKLLIYQAKNDPSSTTTWLELFPFMVSAS